MLNKILLFKRKIILLFIFSFLILLNLRSDDTIENLGGYENANLFLNLINVLKILGCKIDLGKSINAYFYNINDCRLENKISNIEKFLKAVLIVNDIKKNIDIKYINSQNDAKEDDIIINLYNNIPFSEIVFCKDGQWYKTNSLDLKENNDSPIKIMIVKLLEETND